MYKVDVTCRAHFALKATTWCCPMRITACCMLVKLDLLSRL